MPGVGRSPAGDDRRCIRALVTGRVQGVGFRYSTQREALRLGLTGWARNLPDGRVEVVACGASAAVDLLVGFLSVGPRAAVVTGLDVSDAVVDEEPTGFGVG